VEPVRGPPRAAVGQPHRRLGKLHRLGEPAPEATHGRQGGHRDAAGKVVGRLRRGGPSEFGQPDGTVQIAH
jgi:hypothetical protein